MNQKLLLLFLFFPHDITSVTSESLAATFSSGDSSNRSRSNNNADREAFDSKTFDPFMENVVTPPRRVSRVKTAFLFPFCGFSMPGEAGYCGWGNNTVEYEELVKSQQARKISRDRSAITSIDSEGQQDTEVPSRTRRQEGQSLVRVLPVGLPVKILLHFSHATVWSDFNLTTIVVGVSTAKCKARPRKIHSFQPRRVPTSTSTIPSMVEVTVAVVFTIPLTIFDELPQSISSASADQAIETETGVPADERDEPCSSHHRLAVAILYQNLSDAFAATVYNETVELRRTNTLTKRATKSQSKLYNQDGETKYFEDGSWDPDHEFEGARSGDCDPATYTSWRDYPGNQDFRFDGLDGEAADGLGQGGGVLVSGLAITAFLLATAEWAFRKYGVVAYLK